MTQTKLEKLEQARQLLEIGLQYGDQSALQYRKLQEKYDQLSARIQLIRQQTEKGQLFAEIEQAIEQKDWLGLPACILNLPEAQRTSDRGQQLSTELKQKFEDFLAAESVLPAQQIDLALSQWDGLSSPERLKRQEQIDQLNTKINAAVLGEIEQALGQGYWESLPFLAARARVVFARQTPDLRLALIQKLNDEFEQAVKRRSAFPAYQLDRALNEITGKSSAERQASLSSVFAQTASQIGAAASSDSFVFLQAQAELALKILKQQERLAEQALVSSPKQYSEILKATEQVTQQLLEEARRCHPRLPDAPLFKELEGQIFQFYGYAAGRQREWKKYQEAKEAFKAGVQAAGQLSSSNLRQVGNYYKILEACVKELNTNWWDEINWKEEIPRLSNSLKDFMTHTYGSELPKCFDQAQKALKSFRSAHLEPAAPSESPAGENEAGEAQAEESPSQPNAIDFLRQARQFYQKALEVADEAAWQQRLGVTEPLFPVLKKLGEEIAAEERSLPPKDETQPADAAETQQIQSQAANGGRQSRERSVGSQSAPTRSSTPTAASRNRQTHLPAQWVNYVILALLALNLCVVLAASAGGLWILYTRPTSATLTETLAPDAMPIPTLNPESEAAPQETPTSEAAPQAAPTIEAAPQATPAGDAAPQATPTITPTG